MRFVTKTSYLGLDVFSHDRSSSLVTATLHMTYCPLNTGLRLSMKARTASS